MGADESSSRRSIFDHITKIEDDHLERQHFARRLLKRISASDCSTTVGLYGSWGTGKTSILKLMLALQGKVQATENLKLEYLDVWPYEVSGDLSIPIIMQVRKLLKKLPPIQYSYNWRKILGVLAQAGTDIALREFVKVELGDVKNYIENLKDVAPDSTSVRDLEIVIDEIHDARKSFRKLIHLAQEQNDNKRLVFLIDNLDRCSPENVVRLLESIKNFLDAPDCIWVFAMDASVIASYIDRKYEGTRMDGNSYLDKIIPEQYHIPLVSAKDMGMLERFIAVARPAQKSVLPAIDLRKIPQLPEVLVPRLLLKTAHKFYEAYTTDTQRGSSASPDMIFALILLYHSWPSFYERLSSSMAKHIEGVLENFTTKDERGYTNSCIPIPHKYIEDETLAMYLHQSFINGNHLENTCKLLAESMVWLREVGLP